MSAIASRSGISREPIPALATITFPAEALAFAASTAASSAAPSAASTAASIAASTAVPTAALTAVPSAASIAARGVLELGLELRHAGLTRARLHWEWQGADGAPWIVVAGGISAGRHAAACESFPEPGWWDAQVGPGRALDTDHYRVLGIDWVGADGALDLPIDSADQSDAIARLLSHLQVERIEAFVGCSYGAMVGLQFAARHPARLARLVAISGGDCAHPYAIAWRGLQRRIARLGRDEGASRDGLSLARQLAMLSYRTPEEFAERFAAAPTLRDDVACSEADDYLRACGARYVARTTPTAFLRLSESIDLHQVDAADVRVPTTVVAVDQDRLVPVQDLVALAERLPSLRRLQLLRSRYGHDAFLKEEAAIATTLRSALEGTC